MLYWKHPTNPVSPTERGSSLASLSTTPSLVLTHSLCGCQNSHTIQRDIEGRNGCIVVRFQEHF